MSIRLPEVARWGGAPRPRWSRIAGPALLLPILGCDPGFTPTEPAVVVLREVEGPGYLLVSEVDTLVVAADATDGAIVVADLAFSSSDPEVVELRSLPADPDGRTRVELRAVGPGRAEIRTETRDGAPYQAEGLARELVVHERWISVSAGSVHSCGVRWDGAAFCWGAVGHFRFLGDGSSRPSPTPVAVVGPYRYGEISVGWGHTCGTLPGGLVLCWGLNPSGALGTGDADDQLAPTPARFGATLRGFRAGFQTTCGISGTDTAVCWGDDTHGQLGSALASDTCGGRPCSLSPVGVQSPQQLAAGIIPLFTAIGTGHGATCAVSGEDGGTRCWGDNAFGLLGTLEVPASDTARVVETPAFDSVSVGRFQACGLTPDGAVHCWGTGQFGELGSGALPEVCGGRPCSLSPVRISGIPALRSISVGEHTVCGVAADGEAWCWGLGDVGQLGGAATETCSGLPCARDPLPVPPVDGGYARVSVGERHACGLTLRGGAVCWGRGTTGALGDGPVESSDRPVRVADPAPAAALGPAPVNPPG